jgi:hypothetical protein
MRSRLVPTEASVDDPIPRPEAKPAPCPRAARTSAMSPNRSRAPHRRSAQRDRAEPGAGRSSLGGGKGATSSVRRRPGIASASRQRLLSETRSERPAVRASRVDGRAAEKLPRNANSGLGPRGGLARTAGIRRKEKCQARSARLSRVPLFRGIAEEPEWLLRPIHQPVPRGVRRPGPRVRSRRTRGSRRRRGPRCLCRIAGAARS